MTDVSCIALPVVNSTPPSTKLMQHLFEEMNEKMFHICFLFSMGWNLKYHFNVNIVHVYFICNIMFWQAE